jgi:hypothetical protein
LQSGAPDADAALRRVQAELKQMLEVVAMIAMGEGGGAAPAPSAFASILMSSLEAPDDGPLLETGPAVPDTHWEWAVAQIGLSSVQVGRARFRSGYGEGGWREERSGGWVAALVEDKHSCQPPSRSGLHVSC